MTTGAAAFSMEQASDLICPQCQGRVKANDVACPACGVDLAWAAALAERQALMSLPADAETPYQSDVLLPRFGEYLLRRGYITEAQLQAALTRQREMAARGVQVTIGQTLFEMGAASREQLDLASLEQVKQLQDTLATTNRTLEHRVTERTQALQQALQQLAALSELRSNLVGNLTHDLRRPVVPIRGFANLLAEERLGPLADSQRDAVEAILASVTELEAMIKEVGQFTSNLRGHVRLQRSAFAASDMAERLKAYFAARAAAAGIDLHFEVAPDLPALLGDAEKIWWVLFQLFDNALKPMSAGESLTLTVETAGGLIRLTVRDTGPGIPPTRLDEILRLPPEFISRLADSRGWSLAQIKHILAAHGASISVVSRPEQGTTVSFQLPAAERRAAASH
jgi:signal transduction histidine kinase